MKKKLSAALLSFMLVFQVMSSGYLAPFTALANEAPTTQLNDEETPQPKEKTAEEIAAADKALAEATEAVNSLFADADHKNIVEGLDEYRITTVQAIVNKLEDGDDKTKLDELVTIASLLIATKDEEKVEADKEVPATTEKGEETTAPKEETTAPKEDVKKEDVKKEEKPAKAPKKLKVAEVGSVVNPEVSKITLWTDKPDVNNSATNGHELFTPQGKNLTEAPVNMDKGFYALYDWELPKGEYEEGKEYTLSITLPSQFKKATFREGTLFDKEGDKIGTYAPEKDGKDIKISIKPTKEQVTFLAEEPMLGQFWAGHGFSLSEEEKKNENLEVEYKDGDKVIVTVPVKFIPKKVEPKIVKSGEKEVAADGTVKIKWTVDVNNTSEDAKDVTLEDTVSNGLKIEEPIEMTAYNVDGNKDFTTEKPNTTRDAVLNGNTIKLGDIKEPYRVTYFTTIDSKHQDGVQQFKNTVVAKGLSKELTDTATVDIQFGKPIVKEAVSFDAETKIAKWKISVNANHKNLNGSKVTDTFKSGEGYATHEFDKITKVTKIDKDGNSEVVGNDEISKTVASDKGSVVFEIPNGTDQYIIEYSTKLSNRLSNDQIIGNSATFERSSNDVINSGDIKIHAKQGIGVKTGKANFADKTVTWTITLNKDNTGIKDGTEITDVFGNDALNITDEQRAAVLANYINASGDNNATIVEGKDGKGFVLTVKKDLTKTVTFTYITNIDTSKLSKDNNTLQNSLIVGKQETNTGDTKDSATINLTPLTLNNGSKTGTYNPKTKEVKWEVIVNYNLRELSSLDITDEWSNNQTYVDKSMKISELTLEPGQDVYTSGVAKEPTPPPVKTDKGLTFKLPENKKAYKIEYKTKVADIISNQTYTNKIKFKADGKDYELPAKVTPKYAVDEKEDSNPDLMKTGVQNGEYAHWKVIINPAQNKYSGKYIFLDEIKMDGQRFVGLDNVKISKVEASESNNNYLDNVTAKGSLIGFEGITGEKITDNGVIETLEFSFPKGLEQTYVLEYDTVILADDKVEITNNANFFTGEPTETTKPETSKVAVSWEEAGGAAMIKGNGKLKIIKHGPHGNPIKGIKFNILDLDGKVLESVTTDSNGVAETGKKYKFKTYTIQEDENSAGKLGFKPIPETKYLLTDEISEGTTEKPKTAVIENKLTETAINACTYQEITIKAKNDVVSRVSIIVGNEETKLVNSTIEATEEKTFELTPELATKDYKVKISFSNKKSITIDKNQVNWDYKDYKAGEIIKSDDCTGIIELTNDQVSCKNVSMIIKDTTSKVIENAKVTAVNSETVKTVGYTDSEGKVTFEIGKIIPGTTKLVIEKSGYDWKKEVTIDSTAKVIDCQLDMEIKVDAPTNACVDVTFTIKNGEEVAKAGTKVVITDKAEPNKTITHIVTDEDVKNKKFVLPKKELTSASGYTIKVSQEGSKTVTFSNQFIYDCKVELNVKEAAACTTTVVTVKDGENVVANAKVTTVIGEEAVSKTTDAKGQVTFNTALAKDSKISISKSGYEVKEITVGDYVYDCALEVTLTELTACDDVTFTIKNGEALAKAGTKVTIIDQNGNKEIVKDEKLKDGVITVSIKELTSTSGYTIKVSQEGSETVTFEDQFIYDCKVELNVKEAAVCKTTVVTVKDGENAVANAKVTTLINGKTVSMFTDAQGQVTFNTALAKDSKISISKSGYEVKEITVGNYVYDCALEVTLTELTACANVTFTIKNGENFVKAGTKVIITDKAKPNNTITYIVTKEDVLADKFVLPKPELTSDSAYTIEVRETGKKPIIFEKFIYNCEVNLDMASAVACDNITVTFDTKEGSNIKLSENKVYVMDSEDVIIAELKLNPDNQVEIPGRYGNGEYKIVLVQDGKANFVTKIESDDCKQTITVTEESTNGNTCPATTITVKNGSEVIEGAKVVITKTEAGEEATVLFTGTTDEKGKVTTTEYVNLSDKEIKVYVKGYNTNAAIKVSDENCEAEINLATNACPDYAIKAVDQDGKEITNEDFLKGSEFEISGDTEVIEGVKINDIGELVNADGKVLSKVELKASKTAEYTLVQTKTAPGFKKLDDQKVQDLDDCTGLVTINLNKTNDENNPGAFCPDFSVTYKGPENSTAEFKIVKVEKSQGTDGKDVVTETLIEENIKVKTDADKKISSLDLKTKSFVEGTYKLVQTKAHPGYFNAQSKEFKVTEGICVVGLEMTNSPVPPPACAEDMNISVTDTDGKKVSTDNAKVTVDGNETPVTTTDGTVIIPKDLLDSAKESTIIITLEDGRTTTVVLPKDRVECTADAKVPVLKVCEENPTITVKDKNGKDVPTDKIVKVTVNGKEVTPTIENGKVVIPKDSVNPKVDSVVTVTTKGGEEGTVTIPKFSENCDYTIVINNTCDALTVNVTENGKKAENGTVSIIDQNGKVVATQKVTENGKVSFPAKYVDSSYSVKVTIGKVTQLVPVNANENCEVTVNVKTIACEKATIHVTLDGKPVSGATVITLDKKGKEIDVDATDKKGNVSIDPIYANKDHKFEVTVEEESKVVEFTGCDISIGFKTKPVVDGDTEEPNKPGKPDQPEKPTTPPTKPEKPTTPPTKPTTPPTTVDGDSEENAGNHTVKPNNKYDIYDENGNLIHHNAGVDKNGQLEVGKLPAGTYTFVNDKGEKVTVKVGKDGQLPQTGSDQTMLFGLAGVALLGAGLFLIGRNRKRNA